MKKKLLSLILIALLAIGLAACGKSGGGQEGAGSGAAEGPKILKVATSFAYASLDVHKDSNGWYTSIYGMSETLFKMNENVGIDPWLAESAEVDGTVWTIKLKENAAFSNGNPVTADMVIRNLQRLGEVNTGYADFAGKYEMKADGDKTVIIDTKDPYPTLINDLTGSATGIMDLDATTDFDNDPICTGPFVIKNFQPEGDVEVAKNENYWGGDVALDGAIFYYMQTDDSKLLAMQNGEIDCYNSVSSAALAVYQQEPDKYKIVSIPGARLQFYFLNMNTLDDSLREAINLIVDKDAIAAYLEGTVSPAVGPFNASAAYGKVTVPATDPAKAKELIEADGYTMGADGFYEKDGQKLTIKIAYYEARSLDTIAILLKDQFKAVGIDTTFRTEEDADGTYIADGDFDLALYCMIADSSGDPLKFIKNTLEDGAFYDCNGYDNAQIQELIAQLKQETDTAKRAELANQIIQMAIDDNAFGYTGLFNKTTVLRPGVSGFAENIPFDFYGIDAKTTIG
ncbi:MAG: ABC transporter substrate-binding protein [Firmicutes bacterium]|nr:ABC transporter substrate-binding protein [Bacillota bacterium]